MTAGFMVSCMPSTAAVYRYTSPRFYKFCQRSLSKFRSYDASHGRISSRDASDKEESRPKDQRNRRWLLQSLPRIHDEPMQFSILRTTEFNVSQARPKSINEPVVWAGQV